MTNSQRRLDRVQGLGSTPIKGGSVRDHIGDYFRGFLAGYSEFRLWLV